MGEFRKEKEMENQQKKALFKKKESYDYDDLTSYLTKDQINLIEMYLELQKKKKEIEFQKSELELANTQINEAMNALWSEMELAQKIQQVLLPQKPKIKGYQLSVNMIPADLVGGDYYDVINTKDLDWLVIGDVSGHGLSAGLVMMMVQTAIKTVLFENSLIAPQNLLSTVNKSITANIQKLSEIKYITITVMAVNGQGQCTFSGLHQDILIYRLKQNNVEIVETNGMWLGIEDDISQMLELGWISLDKGDVLFLFTDGLTEAIDANGDMFGNEKVIEILQNHGKKDTEQIKNEILNVIDDLKKPDDVTFILLKRME